MKAFQVLPPKRVVIFLVSTLISIQFKAADLYVNSTYSNSDGISTFTSITSAVQASAPGDRIVIESGTYNEATLTLPHSLTLMPATSGTTVDFLAHIYFTSGENVLYELFGIRLGQYGFWSSNHGSMSNRSRVHLIDCAAANVGFEADGWDVHLIKCAVTGNTIIRHGDAVLCSFYNFYLRSESGSEISSRQLNIIQNSISEVLWIVSDNAHFRIANNYLKHLHIQGWHTSTSIRNDIVNNDFAGGNLHISFQGVPAYNLRFINNQNQTYRNHCDGGHWDCQGDFMAECPTGCDSGPLGFDCNIPGYFEWSYNSWTPSFSCEPHAGQSLIFRKVYPSIGDPVNGGNPAHEFYDTDLTINDRGRTGGLWGTSNFPDNTPGSAYLYTLEMPSDLFPGIPASLKAKGYQRH